MSRSTGRPRKRGLRTRPATLGCPDATARVAGPLQQLPALTAQVRAVFLADLELRACGIHIFTSGRTVRLAGLLRSEAMRGRAVSAASTVPGVATVRSDLIVQHDGVRRLRHGA